LGSVIDIFYILTVHILREAFPSFFSFSCYCSIVLHPQRFLLDHCVSVFWHELYIGVPSLDNNCMVFNVPECFQFNTTMLHAE